MRSLPTCEQFLVNGIGQPVARSTRADANEKRNWRIFADFATF